MDAAASVIAVVQITEQVMTLCYKYAKAVKDAPGDIIRVQNELRDLQAMLQGADKLLKGPHKDKLQTSTKLCASLAECEKELTALSAKLTTQSGDLHLHRFSRTRVKWPLERKEVIELVKTFHGCRGNLSACLSIDHTSVTLSVFEKLEEEERNKILDWISSIQYGKHHNTVVEKRTPGTCMWLLQNETFKQWLNQKSNTVMWLHGIPGAGKTFITSKVIDFVQEQLHDDPTSKEGFAFFYCNRNEPIRREPKSILQSYSRQLANVYGKPTLTQTHLRTLWLDSRAKGQDLGMTACKEQILKSIDSYDRTTLVLDALDECEIQSRMVIMDDLQHIMSKATKPLRVFISSRPEGDIRSLFKDVPKVEIQATDNHDDIKLFVHQEIVRHPRWNVLSQDLREEIEETILEKSQGMFQWAYLQINQLLDLKTRAAIKNRLGKLPIGLTGTYDEIYARIADGDSYEKAIADRAFKWVACALIPLSTEQILDAVRCDPEDISNPAEELQPEDLLDICRNLLVFDSQRDVWRFSHLSVTEYFETHRWTRNEAHIYATSVCLELLIEGQQGPQSTLDARNKENGYDKTSKSKGNVQKIEYRPNSGTERLTGKVSFQFYYHHFWVGHVQALEDRKTLEGHKKEHDPGVVHRLKTFLGSPIISSKHYQRWYSLVYMWPTGGLPFSLISLSPQTSTVFCICRCSFYTILEDWWTSGELPLSSSNDIGQTCLELAIRSGQLPIVKAIVDRGVDVNQKADSLRSALAAAAHEGMLGAVQYLVKSGAIVDLQLEDADYGSALAAAVAGSGPDGKLDVIKHLLDSGADVNLQIKEGTCGSALATAVASRSRRAVLFLYDHGAEVNMVLKYGSYKNAFEAAIYADLRCNNYRGHDMARLMVQLGADTNNMPLNTPLDKALGSAASSFPDYKRIRYILDCGADPNALLDDSDGSPLVAAMNLDDISCIYLMLDHGGDPNLLVNHGRYGSVLTCAAQNDRVPGNKVVRKLLQYGADVNLLPRIGNFGSPLVAACVGAQPSRVRYLVKKGAFLNPDLLCGDYGSALCAAVARNSRRIVTYLVESGADVNYRPKIGRFGSALATACLYNMLDCVKYLLTKGAVVGLELFTGKYKTAREAAIATEYMTRRRFTQGAERRSKSTWRLTKDNNQIISLLDEFSRRRVIDGGEPVVAVNVDENGPGEKARGGPCGKVKDVLQVTTEVELKPHVAPGREEVERVPDVDINYWHYNEIVADWDTVDESVKSYPESDDNSFFEADADSEGEDGEKKVHEWTWAQERQRRVEEFLARLHHE